VLALAPAAPWFPHAAVQLAWVLFDLLLILALRTLLQRHTFAPRTMMARGRTARLATALAACVSLDALLTAWQAWVFNIPRVTTNVDGVIVLLACAGPLVAAPVLWGAARRLRMLARPRPSFDWPSSLTT
jgi:hypothetical protein